MLLVSFGRFLCFGFCLLILGRGGLDSLPHVAQPFKHAGNPAHVLTLSLSPRGTLQAMLQLFWISEKMSACFKTNGHDRAGKYMQKIF